MYRAYPLLVKNSVYVTDSDSSTVDGSALIKYVTPVPNSKFLGLVRHKLWFYEVATLGKKETKLKNWMKTSLGEPPVYADTLKFIRSEQQLKQQLFNLGYFNPYIYYKTDTTRKGNVKESYYVTSGKPYIYDDIKIDLANADIRRLAYRDTTASLIKHGDIFNSYTLDRERERIELSARNNGYYLYSRDLIYYTADTNLMNNKLNIVVKDINPTITDKGVQTQIPQHKYYINDINIYPNYDYSVDYEEPGRFDINRIIVRPSDTTVDGRYCFHEIGKSRLRWKAVIDALEFHPGDEYCYEDVLHSNKGLSTLNIIRYTNITFSPATSFNDSLLNCNIELTRRPVHSPSIETELTNNSGKLGMGLNLVYNNRNIFRGGELFALKALGSVELQITGKEDNTQLLHTVRYGGSVGLYFPRFLAPAKIIRVPQYLYPKTTIEMGYNYQKRAIYTRHIVNATYSYAWQQNAVLSHQLTPIDVNVVKIDNSKEFQEILDNMTNTLYKSQYTDHILFGGRYSIIFNNQDRTNIGDFFYVRASVETSGNFLNAINRAFKMQKEEGEDYYRIFKVRYAQYLLSDIDLKHFHYFTNNKVIVTRLAFGVGLPYSNSVALPMEKGFYGGGANDMRGWALKSLGPGSFSSDVSIERLGDIALKANMEFRFPLYKFLRAAIFVDAGNIWLMKEDSDFPGGEFKWNRFYKEIAVDAGVGVRLDFNFFVLRLDAAAPLVDPSYSEKSRFRNDLKFSDVVWNIGIGYPF